MLSKLGVEGRETRPDATACMFIIVVHASSVDTLKELMPSMISS